MPRKESDALPEGKGSIPLYVLPGGISLEDLRRIMQETWDEFCEKNGLKKPFRPTGEKVGRDSAEEQISVKQDKSRMLGSHVSPWR